MHLDELNCQRQQKPQQSMKHTRRADDAVNRQHDESAATATTEVVNSRQIG